MDSEEDLFDEDVSQGQGHHDTMPQHGRRYRPHQAKHRGSYHYKHHYKRHQGSRTRSASTPQAISVGQQKTVPLFDEYDEASQGLNIPIICISPPGTHKKTEVLGEYFLSYITSLPHLLIPSSLLKNPMYNSNLMLPNDFSWKISSLAPVRSPNSL